MITIPRTLIDREVQVSDTLVYRKDLPKNMKISAIDVGFRFTNGGTLAANKDALEIINHLTLLFNGTEAKFNLTGKDCYHYNRVRMGYNLKNTFVDTISATSEFWLRIPCGRFLGDPNFGLDTSKSDNVQLQVDYALSNFGTVGTHVITGTLSITIVMHVFGPKSQPSFQGMIGCREFWTGTTVASRANLQSLPSQKPITSLFVSCREDAIADAVDITDISVGKDNMNNVLIAGKWYNLQVEQRARIGLMEENFVMSPTSGATLITHVGNIKKVVITPNTITAVT